MDFAALTGQLAHRIGLPALEPDSSGRVQMTFGPLVVDIEPLPDHVGFVMVGRLGAGTSLSGAALYRRLLENNLLGRLASGTYFALDPTSSQVVICRRQESDVGYQAFEADLERFLDELDEARRSLTQGQGAAEQSATPFEYAIRA